MQVTKFGVALMVLMMLAVAARFAGARAGSGAGQTMASVAGSQP
jgi:hypothetical protein